MDNRSELVTLFLTPNVFHSHKLICKIFNTVGASCAHHGLGSNRSSVQPALGKSFNFQIKSAEVAVSLPDSAGVGQGEVLKDKGKRIRDKTKRFQDLRFRSSGLGFGVSHDAYEYSL
jgi:hypothetical protein